MTYPMAYPMSDNWYSIGPSSSPATYFSVQHTGTAAQLSATFEITNTAAINSDWQFIASTPNDVYYIRNHDMGPDVQLTVTITSLQQYLGEPVNVYTVNFATSNDSDPNQQWLLQPAQPLFFIRSYGPPKGYLTDMSPWFGSNEYNAGDLWILGPRGTITETAFTNTTTPTSAPVPTTSTTGPSSSPHSALYIEIGAAIIALILAVVIGLFLYKNNAARRKRLLLEGSEHELDYVYANFPTVRPRTDPELPFYHEARGHRRVNESEYDAGRAAEIQAPPPTYSPNGEEDPIASLARSPPPQQSSPQQPLQPPEYENLSLRNTVAGTATVGEETPVEEESNSTPPDDLGLSPSYSATTTTHDRSREEEVIDSLEPEPSQPPEYSAPSPGAPANISHDSESIGRETPDEIQAHNTATEHRESPP